MWHTDNQFRQADYQCAVEPGPGKLSAGLRPTICSLSWRKEGKMTTVNAQPAQLETHDVTGLVNNVIADNDLGPKETSRGT